MKNKYIIWHDKSPEDKQEFWIKENEDLLDYARKLGFEDRHFPFLNFQLAPE